MIRDKSIFLVACQRALITVVISIAGMYCAKSIATEQGSSKQQALAPKTDAGIELAWALEQSLLNNIALKSFPYSLRASEALSLQAGITPNPELSVSVENILGTGDMQGVDNAEITLALSQLIELGDKRQRRIDYAQASQRQQLSDYESTRLQVLAQTTERYYQLLRLQALQTWIERRIELEQASLAAIKDRASAGAVIQADVSKMQLRLVRSNALKQRIDGDFNVAKKKLSAMWSSEVKFARANDELQPLNVLPTAASVLNAIETAPQYLQLLSVERLLIAKRRMEESKATSDITLGVGVKSYDGFDDGALMLNFSMPLQFSNPNEGNILAAKAEEDKAHEQQRFAREQLKLTLLELHQSMLNNAKQAQMLKAQVLPLAKKLQQHTQSAYQTGQVNVLQLADAQSELFSVERELIEAKTAVYMALLAIERITGQSMTVANTNMKPVVAMENR
ncbi:Outer membrane efflux protein [Shewanella piezotolerans WP3]|uniref:Outer membrane efflux protein n=1 Tax=Shewanella piezotolerans (strain WP3 / JCM 13877) TaxID=225849 RepID=B8CPV8_SHEPW|nr:TolC family protein [Shewanella piezotolerans]ACJ29821.1 Outer membrane efflux protein [Shewanella piezotolerans WP3]